MTSKLTRERLQELAEGQSGFNLRTATHGESQELARMALAAMNSEPVEMPLDYLQGHKDGLEWASQLAEANHPETGFTMTLSSWQKLFAKVQICRQRSR